jgi:excisionase family DNA binding protein
MQIMLKDDGPQYRAEYNGWLRRAKNFAPTDELLSVDQVAERLGVPKGTVYELTRQRANVRGVPLPHFKIGKRLKFNWSAVVTWVDGLEKGGTQ